MDAVKLGACVLFVCTGTAQFASSLSRPKRRTSALMLLCFGLALLLTLDGPYLAFDGALGVSNLAELVSHLAGLTGIGVMTYLLLDVDDRSRTARHREVTALSVMLTATTGLFVASDVPREAPAFAATYGAQTSVLAFWALSATYALVCLVRLARTVSRSTAFGTRRDVVHGMRVSAVGGGLFGTAYIALKAVEIGYLRADRRLPSMHIWQQAALAPGMACLALGLGLPLAGRMVADGRQQLRVRHGLVRLRAMRHDLVGRGLIADGGPTLSSGGSVISDLIGARADARLLRRVIEIRDALLLDGFPLSAAPDVGHPRRGLDLLDEADRLAALRPGPATGAVT